MKDTLRRLAESARISGRSAHSEGTGTIPHVAGSSRSSSLRKPSEEDDTPREDRTSALSQTVRAQVQQSGVSYTDEQMDGKIQNIVKQMMQDQQPKPRPVLRRMLKLKGMWVRTFRSTLKRRERPGQRY
jgi:hypothetical protein